MLVFLAGGTGVLGRRLVPLLVRQGHDVTAAARSDAAVAALESMGATAVRCDLADESGLVAVLEGHDAVVNMATSIPTGLGAATRRAWRANDRLRREASRALTAAAARCGVGRYVQESITFPYVDCGPDWIDEDTPCTYFWGNRTVRDAEAAAGDFAEAHGTGVVLRFAMFWADDSAHLRTFAGGARKGRWLLPGDDDASVSFVHVDDAAGAAVAALAAPSGIYNVAEPDPRPRGEHRAALARSVGRDTVRPLPGFLTSVGGASMESLARSQRVSSERLTTATGWRPERQVVEHWGALT